CFDPAQSRALAFFSIPFFQQPAPTDIYSLSLHDALPIWHAFFMERGRIWTVLYLGKWPWFLGEAAGSVLQSPFDWQMQGRMWLRSEEHTSELQSRENLVCRLLLEKKNNSKERDPYPHSSP